MDDKSRIATVRIGDAMGDSTPWEKYVLENNIGSSMFLLDENAAMVNEQEYYPFGETSFGSYGKKKYQYCGKERDSESGLYYYGARYYLPWLCRFASVDPLKDKYAFYTPYQYAGNKPINFIDLDGLEEASNGTSAVSVSGQGKDAAPTSSTAVNTIAPIPLASDNNINASKPTSINSTSKPFSPASSTNVNSSSPIPIASKTTQKAPQNTSGGYDQNKSVLKSTNMSSDAVEGRKQAKINNIIQQHKEGREALDPFAAKMGQNPAIQGTAISMLSGGIASSAASSSFFAINSFETMALNGSINLVGQGMVRGFNNIDYIDVLSSVTFKNNLTNNVISSTIDIKNNGVSIIGFNKDLSSSFVEFSTGLAFGKLNTTASDIIQSSSFLTVPTGYFLRFSIGSTTEMTNQGIQKIFE